MMTGVITRHLIVWDNNDSGEKKTSSKSAWARKSQGHALLKPQILVLFNKASLKGKSVWLQTSDNGAVGLPSGELVYTAPSGMQRFATSLRLIRALPWRRFKKGSVLVIEVIYTLNAFVECFARVALPFS